MIEPELEILHRLIERIERLQASADGDLAWMEKQPGNLAEFEAMSSHRQSAARAVLKSFEQIEDQLSRAFRVIPKLMGEETRRWFARDYADYMDRFGVLEDIGAWSKIVKLRNMLVHDYPLDPQVQFDRLIEAISYLPLLAATHRRLAAFAHDELPGKVI